MRHPRRALLPTVLASLVWLAAAAPVAAATTPGRACETRAARELRTCDNAIVRRQLSCVEKTGAICAASDARIQSSLDRLASRVLGDCPDQATVTAAGDPAALTPAGLVSRLQEACGSVAMTLVARSFGGPQIAVRDTADRTQRACLDNAYNQGRSVVDYAFWQQSSCLEALHAGRTCDPSRVAARIAAKVSRATTAVSRRCADLSALVAVDPATFVTRATDQAGCLVPAAHGQTAPLTLACGPRASVPVPPLGVSTKIVLDSSVWGTRCGDGSDYSFSIHPAPAGYPIGRIVVFMEGGGSCADGPDCAATYATKPGLFSSADEGLPEVGLISSTNPANPFANWTKVYIPYCTQDGHTGGGIVNAFPEITVYRYGAVNVRAAMRYVRDVMWSALDASDPQGFRPDRLTVLFSGSSAGGIGAQFNYHYILDDLRWVHSTLLPDSALGVDNGQGATLQRGALVFGATTPGWGGLPMAPPYCHEDACGEGWNHFLFAMAPRLKMTPEQQVLSLSNQLDATQRSVGQFASNADFVNTLRTEYCAQRGTIGLHSYLPDTQPQVHGNLNDNTRYNQVYVDGVLMHDWIAQAMADPDGVVDLVGTGLTSITGVLPFPCDVGSPSGAFVDAAPASFY